jgi:hypothetical protein
MMERFEQRQENKSGTWESDLERGDDETDSLPLRVYKHSTTISVEFSEIDETS